LGQNRHCERSDAIQENAGRLTTPRLLRRFAPKKKLGCAALIVHEF
jgi:hypothetical protein